ncbi:MAG: response regulator [Betaproteobacteria bacterium]|nr:response regulator [Betaproteobacteria bacterium]
MSTQQSAEDQQRLREDAESLPCDQPAAAPPRPERPAEELLHELQVHRIELEMQNDELRRAQLVSEESRDRYLDLYDFAPVGYFTLDRAATVIEANLTGAEMFGMTRKDLLLRRFANFVSPEDRGHWARHFMNTMNHGEKQSCELELCGVGGHPFQARLDCLRMERGGEPAVARIALTNVTERKRIEQALRESQADLNRAQEVGQIGSWRLNVHRNELLWSDQNHRIFGIPKGTPLTYEMFLALVHPQDREYVDQQWEAALGGAPYDIEHRLVVEGGVKWVRERAELEFDAAGRLLGGFGTTQDITELKLAELALIEADRRKDEFLAMLGHELRNPLAPIRNAAHVLARLETQEPKVRWAQEIIERQVVHLTRLVDDLLDVSRIVRGKVALQRETVALADVLGHAVDMARPLIEAKGHRLDVRLPEQPVWLQADPVRLAQVLLNLLDNAAKYTPEGGHIELVARVGGETLEIRLRDNGIGIPADLRPRIFDLFQQGERGLDRTQGGLGIGLTLVKRLVELHGGLIEATSTGQGQGAEFTIRLPLLVDAPPAPARDASKPAATACRVLVVDDDPAVADSMATLLTIEGHEVRTASGGEEALQQARDFRPHLVLLDIGLHGMDGYEAARRLRAQQPQGEPLCLVAVTGYGHEEARLRVREAGFDRHLVKPVEPETICDLLTKIDGGLR